MSDPLPLKSIAELNGYCFLIPFQQRGYKWTEDNVLLLLKDFHDFIQSGKLLFCLQPLSIYKEENKFVVIDGQQRLTTIFLLMKYLREEKGNSDLPNYSLEYERDNSKRADLLQKPINRQLDDDADTFYITRAYLTIKKAFDEGEYKDKSDLFVKLLKNTKDKNSVQVIWYLLNKDQSHSIFRDLNSGKIQLSNAELIKALLLNRTNGLQNHEMIAAQFEAIERSLDNDRLWYMFSDREPSRDRGQSRIDLIFNIATKVEPNEYDIEFRKSFFKLSASEGPNALDLFWERVMEIHSRIQDFYKDIYLYHYVGFLNYCQRGGKENRLKELIESSEKEGKQAFKERLKKELVRLVSVEEGEEFLPERYDYDSTSKEMLRRIFILHNIATLLSSYNSMNDAIKKKKKGETRAYEYFPFDLLHKQSWDIEHISSQTENTFKSDSDRKDWLEAVKKDYDFPASEEGSEDKNHIELLRLHNALHNARGSSYADLFNQFYKKFVEVYDNRLKENHKNGLGNLVLLDSHTNRSFHNSLFPRKRRIVIMANGGIQDNDLKEKVERTFIPVCTWNVYLKAYNKRRDVSLTNWTDDDYAAYCEDIRKRINDCFVK